MDGDTQPRSDIRNLAARCNYCYRIGSPRATCFVTSLKDEWEKRWPEPWYKPIKKLRNAVKLNDLFAYIHCKEEVATNREVA